MKYRQNSNLRRLRNVTIVICLCFQFEQFLEYNLNRFSTSCVNFCRRCNCNKYVIEQFAELKSYCGHSTNYRELIPEKYEIIDATLTVEWKTVILLTHRNQMAKCRRVA